MSDFYSGYFSVHTESAGELKSFSATSRNGTHILKLEVSYASAAEMGYALDSLSKLAAAIKDLKSAKRRKAGAILALPAPAREARE